MEQSRLTIKPFDFYDDKKMRRGLVYLSHLRTPNARLTCKSLHTYALQTEIDRYKFVITKRDGEYKFVITRCADEYKISYTFGYPTYVPIIDFVCPSYQIRWQKSPNHARSYYTYTIWYNEAWYMAFIERFNRFLVQADDDVFDERYQIAHEHTDQTMPMHTDEVMDHIINHKIREWMIANLTKI